MRLSHLPMRLYVFECRVAPLRVRGAKGPTEWGSQVLWGSMRLRADAKCWLTRILRDLHVAQPFPSTVLFGFFLLGIFVALKPKAKPVHRITLRNHALGRITENVRAILSHSDKFYRLFQIAQGCIWLPHAQQVAGAQSYDLQWAGHLV